MPRARELCCGSQTRAPYARRNFHSDSLCPTPCEKMSPGMWRLDAASRMRTGFGKPEGRPLLLASGLRGLRATRCDRFAGFVSPGLIWSQLKRGKKIIFFWQGWQSLHPIHAEIRHAKILAVHGFFRITLWKNFGYLRLFTAVHACTRLFADKKMFHSFRLGGGRRHRFKAGVPVRALSRSPYKTIGLLPCPQRK